MNTTNKNVGLLISAILFFNYAFSQKSLKNRGGIDRSTIHISLAPDVAYNAATIFYDHIITHNGKLATFARVGYGGWAKLLIGAGTQTFAQGGIIVGTNKKKFEASAGVAFQNEKTDDITKSSTVPAVSLGIRSQKPGKHFVFRAGLGYPEGIYVGLGHSF